VFARYVYVRWRNSFLFGLLFGGPTMAIMIYYMLTMSCHRQDSESDFGLNSTDSSLAANATVESCHPMLMIVHGLSLRNLLLFIFCTPCQVSLEHSLQTFSGKKQFNLDPLEFLLLCPG